MNQRRSGIARAQLQRSSDSLGSLLSFNMKSAYTHVDFQQEMLRCEHARF